MTSESNSQLGRCAKRCREENAPDEIKRHETLYFADGDIVLLSLPKDHVITAFRVDKVFLSRHSPVFKDMFSFPSPDDSDVEKYDDIPLVHLQDKAEHLGSLLNALYYPSAIPHRKHHIDTATLVKGMLKISTKYQCDNLRERIVEQLSNDWPSDLCSWDVAAKGISVIVDEIDSDDGVQEVIPEPCSVIRLARECDIPHILPAAFYHLSRIPPFAELDTLKTNCDKKYWDYVEVNGRRARFTLLSRDDLMCLVKGTKAMTAFVHELGSTASRDAKDKCKSKGQAVCRKTIRRYRVTIEADVSRGSDPLSTLDKDTLWHRIPDTLVFFDIRAPASCLFFFLHHNPTSQQPYVYECRLPPFLELLLLAIPINMQCLPPLHAHLPEAEPRARFRIPVRRACESERTA